MRFAVPNRGINPLSTILLQFVTVLSYELRVGLADLITDLEAGYMS